jgi:pyrroline-5-carboxylate reductase
MLNKSTQPVRVAFIGGGNMAGALIGGLSDRPDQPVEIHVVDVNADSLQNLKDRFQVTTSQQIDKQLQSADVIVLSVKPQQMREVAEKLAPHIKHQLIISIAAGIRIGDLSRWLNHYQCIVRTMPNMPALINQGITGMVAANEVSQEQRSLADTILAAVGQTVWLNDETMLDPVTAVSGSGPAYVFYFIEAIQQAAQELGFTTEQARQLTIGTFTGAAQLASNSSESAAALRERVTSKGGTTHAAITSMEQSGVKEAIIKALKAASARSKALGDEFGR